MCIEGKEPKKGSSPKLRKESDIYKFMKRDLGLGVNNQMSVITCVFLASSSANMNEGLSGLVEPTP
jgi:hypothetical protein